MDYHNNEIGRQLYQIHTDFEKFLWIKTDLVEPTVDELKIYAYQIIESSGVFIDLNTLAPSSQPIKQQEEAYLKIIKVEKTNPVYLSKNLKQ